MADGALIGRRAALGQVNIASAAATVVATVTLPNTEGHYHIIARIAGGNASKSTKFAIIEHADVMVDGGAAEIGTQGVISNIGASGVTPDFAVSGLDVQIRLADANGFRAVAMAEAFGVEMVLTAA